MSAKVYEIITDRIIEALERGDAVWRKPWGSNAQATPRNLVSGKPYRGINRFLLSMGAFESPYFLTFKQAQERGGSVRKGEKGTPIVFFKTIEKAAEVQGEDPDKYFVARYFTVFNVTQCEGVEYPKPEADAPRETPRVLEACESLVERAPKPEIRSGGNSAFYHPVFDFIQMPERSSFHSSEGYYATLFHELAHSTGHESRLKRESLQKVSGFGSHEYSKEELTAEMAAAFLCAETGLVDSTLENHAAYCKSWLKVLRNDRKFLVSAAAQAQKAADFLLRREN